MLKAIQSAPLRLLTADSIGSYAACAMTTVGGPSDYGHFLPRIVELALDDPPYLGFEPWLIVRKLKYADGNAFPRWPGWHASQRTALRATFLAAWERALSKSSADENATRWLDALASLGQVTDALEIWQRTSSPFAVEHLASFVLEHQKWLVKGDRIGGRCTQDAAPDVRDDHGLAPPAGSLAAAEKRPLRRTKPAVADRRRADGIAAYRGTVLKPGAYREKA